MPVSLSEIQKGGTQKERKRDTHRHREIIRVFNAPYLLLAERVYHAEPFAGAQGRLVQTEPFKLYGITVQLRLLDKTCSQGHTVRHGKLFIYGRERCR